MTALDGPVAELTMWLPRAAALTAHPDTGAATRGGKPGSRPPWNQAAANAEHDGIAAVGEWELKLRYLVTGSSGHRRPASATGSALRAILSLAHAVPQNYVREAARDFTHVTRQCKVLDAVDEEERPQKVTWQCPYCAMPMMRLFPRAATVVCLRGGFACFDSDGNPPLGRAEIGRLGPCVVWADGLVS